MSDTESDVSEWAVLGDQDTAQDSEGSNDFVCVEDDKNVRYHHRLPAQDGAAADVGDAALSVGPTSDVESSAEISPTTGLPEEEERSGDSESSSVSDAVTLTTAAAQDETDSISSSSCSLEKLDIPGEGDALSQSSSSLEELSFPVTGGEPGSSLSRQDEPRTSLLEQDGPASSLLEQDGPGTSLVEQDEPVTSALDRNSGCGKEDLNGSRDDQVNDWQPLGADRSLLSSMRMRKPSGSDTDQSDFVRLDASQSDDLGSDLMNLSSASSLTSGSSVSQTFRFIHRSDMVLGEEPSKRVFYRDNDEDSVQSDIDDRCESDISGVAGDDSDLSHLTYSLGDVPIAAGDVARSYKHRPNNSLNSTLTVIALVALFFALGIGCGDFIGFHRQAGLRLQQVGKLRSLQDDYLVCLQEAEERDGILEQQEQENELIQAVTEEWKQQYEELIVERVALESKIEELQERMSRDSEAGRQILRDLQGSRLSRLVDELESGQTSTPDTHTALVMAAPAEKDQSADVTGSPGVSKQDEPSCEVLTKLQTEVDTLTEENEELVFKMRLIKDDILIEKEDVLDLQQKLQLKLADNVTTQLQREVDLLEREKSELLFRMDVMRHDVLSENQQLRELERRVERRLERADQLSVENEELRREVSELRASQQPGHRVSTQTPVEYRTLKTPDSDERADWLKWEISRLEGEVDDLQQKLRSMSEDLHRESRSAALWQERFVQTSHQLQQVLKKSPDIAKCLSFIIPAVTLGEMSGVSGDALRNLTGFVTNQMDVIQKLADDSEFVATVNSRWERLREMLQSPLAGDLVGQTEAAYQDIRRLVMDQFQSLGGVLFETSQPDQGRPNSEGSGEEINSYHTRLHRMVNRTKETVTKLTKKINQTWEKVKDVSGHVTSKVLQDVVPVVRENVGKLRGHVKHGWDKIKKQVKGGLFERKGKKEKKKQQRKNEKHKDARGERSSERGHNKMSEEDRRQYHGDPYKNDGYSHHIDETFTQTHTHQFEHKPDHKQKASDTHMDKAPQSLNFWDKVGFNPDMLLHDDFFEGNERKWRKQQKELKKLHGRISRLSEDVLHDMDDDDIEDLYEDLEDFQDDLEDEVQPTGLQTWLTCQMRWWKGRFQRKHRSEDLIKGCGRQLMHWQVKASCEVKGHGNHLVCVPACLQYFPHRSVIQTVADEASFFSAKKKRQHYSHSRKDAKNFSETSKGRKVGAHQQKHKNVEHCGKKNGNCYEGQSFSNEEDFQYNFKKMNEDHSSHFIAEDVVNTTMDDAKSADWWFEREQLRENSHQVSGDWYWKPKPHHQPDLTPTFSTQESWLSGVEESDADSSWYFKREEVREFYHHDPRWIFGRAKVREFNREKPWYLRRADKRSDERNKYKDD